MYTHTHRCCGAMLVVFILVSLTIVYIAWSLFKGFISDSSVIGPLLSPLMQLEQPPHASHTAEL